MMFKKLFLYHFVMVNLREKVKSTYIWCEILFDYLLSSL